MLPRNCRRLQRWVFLLGMAVRFARASDALSEADKSVASFVNLQIETARLESEWRSQRGLLESMVTAARERAALLEDRRDLTKAKTAKDREELETLRASQQRARDGLKMFESRLAALSAKLLALRPELPPRLADALEMSYRSLSDKALPAGERTLLAMNMLNRCGQFNRIITVGTDVLSLEGEPPDKSFETIYWGLSHGYALDRVSHKVWFGGPGSGGWQWHPTSDAFDHVAQLIAIATEKADPEFVAAPAIVTRSLDDTRAFKP